MAANANRLSYRQFEELRRLVKSPHSYFGSCTNATMKALQRRGLVSLEWSGEWPHRKSTWVITNDGKAVVVPQPAKGDGQ